MILGMLLGAVRGCVRPFLNGYSSYRLLELEKEVKLLKAEMMAFRAEILDDLTERLEKLTKRIHQRYKRGKGEEEEDDREERKVSDPFDEVRKLYKPSDRIGL